MFNAEKLLGKILKETLGGGGSKKKSGLFDSLTSGAGLMTVVGLGVGAFEILKDKKGTTSSAPSVIPSIPETSGAVPPPLPGATKAAASPPPMPSAKGEDLALRFIQVMIAAAHADGTLDKSEEKAILDHLRGADLDQEEKMFLIDELHRPKSLPELTAGVDDPSMRKTMYMLAVATIEVDTEEERSWLDELGETLDISTEVRSFIEDQS